MTPRTPVLIAALVLISLLAFLTVRGAVEDGLSGLVVLSLVILAVLGFGVVGALTGEHDD